MSLKIGHRGACGYEPENTLLAFKKALDLGVDMVELDVRLTKDKQVVVIHDFRVNRTTNGRGWVSRMTLGQIKQLDAGKGENIPTLKEALDYLDGKCQVNIEIKTIRAIPYVMQEIIAAKFKNSNIMVSSNYLNILRKIKKEIPDIKVAWLFRANDNTLKQTLWLGILMVFYPFTKYYVINQLKKNGIDTVNIHHLLATKNLVKRIHKHNKIFIAWVVNKPRKIDWLKEWGVEGIISDYPDRL